LDIERLRSQVTSGEKPLRITTHAQVEAAKDGLLPDTPTDKIPAHIVVEDTEAEGVIVTAYVPDPAIWIANVRRRRKG